MPDYEMDIGAVMVVYIVAELVDDIVADHKPVYLYSVQDIEAVLLGHHQSKWVLHVDHLLLHQ